MVLRLIIKLKDLISKLQSMNYNLQTHLKLECKRPLSRGLYQMLIFKS